jgi:hypothetical protein
MALTWVNLDFAHDRWTDSKGMDDYVLTTYLEAAQDACEAFAPVVADPLNVPMSYRIAVVAQARSIWRAIELGNQDGGVGADGYVVPTFPLDWQVQQLLRPKRRGVGQIA